MAMVSVSDFKNRAQISLSKNAYDYYRSGAGEEYTLKMNKDAFDT